MFPEINADFDSLTPATTETGTTVGADFVFDFSAGEHSFIDGRMQECTPEQAVMQWVELVLRTEAGKYAVYTEDEDVSFGLSVYKYIGMKQ